jgi:formate hydrogenlyase subunit 6/NADH:ubiquinone oxidoreductase subunit I
VEKLVKIHPQVEPANCIGCGKCAESCPADAITRGKPPSFDLERCIGCLCCAEICPQGTINTHRNWVARILGVGI